MFFNSYYCPYPPCFRIKPEISYVRILHASPDAPLVDIYLDNVLTLRNVGYKNFSEYLPIPLGLHNIKVVPAATKNNPVINTNIYIPEMKIFTAAIIGNLNNISIKLIPEPVIPIKPTKAMIRFIHLSPDAPAVDITLPNGTKLFDNVKYQEITDYIEVNPGIYTAQARIAGTDNVVLTVPNIRLTPNKFYSVYAVGLAKGTPSLQVLIPLDGNTYLKF